MKYLRNEWKAYKIFWRILGETAEKIILRKIGIIFASLKFILENSEKVWENFVLYTFYKQKLISAEVDLPSINS